MATPSDAGPRSDPAPAPTEPPPLAAAVLLVVAAFAVVVSAVGSRHGFHRDELYFLSTAERLDWGYVDQPPATAVLARLAVALFGPTVWGLRVVATVAGCATVGLAALTARELGGGRSAQVLASSCTALSGIVLTTGWTFATVTFDVLVWATITWLTARLLRTGDERLWLAIGGAFGVGVLTKHLVVLLGLGLLVGLVVADRRRLRSPWLVGGVVLAAAVALPNVLWQVDHDWAALEMGDALRSRLDGVGARLEVVLAQLVINNPALAPVWITGLVWLLRDGPGRRWRPLGIAWPVVLGALVAVGGKPYYATGLVPLLFAAGAVRLTSLAPAARPRWGRSPGAVVLGLAATAVVVISLPVLPASATGSSPLHDINPELAETVGWPELVAQVAAVHDGLPPGDRAGAVVLTLTYAEAGALERYADDHDVPEIASGHNSWWWWGPPAGEGPVIAVGYEPEALAPLLGGCEVVDRVAAPHDLPTKDAGMAITVCSAPHRPWREIWPALRHYD